MARLPILPGDTFERLTVESCLSGDKYECRCECGSVAIVSRSNLLTGHTRSCGCLRAQAIKSHGLSRSPEYAAWANIYNRCVNAKHPNWNNYGSRGVTLCDSWRGAGGFAAFFAHIGPRPSRDYTVERIDNDKGYEPGNVRWATRREQMRNTRRNHWIEIDGERKLISDWAKVKDIDATTICHRIKRGMSQRDAVMAPARFGGRRATPIQSNS